MSRAPKEKAAPLLLDTHALLVSPIPPSSKALFLSCQDCAAQGRRPQNIDQLAPSAVNLPLYASHERTNALFAPRKQNEIATREMMKKHIQPPSPPSPPSHPLPPSPPSIDYQSLVFLAAGGSGIIYAIDEERVLKEFYSKGIDVECRAFQRLGLHVNIVKCFGAIDNSLILERGRSIRKVIQESGADQIPLDTKIRWLQEAAEGTRYMHNNHIIHADIGCNNWIIVQGRLKIIDFEGCSIDGEEAGACYEWFSCKESTPLISQKTDIFAFGCAIYEVITGRQPHDELLEFEDRTFRVRQLYAENHFPDVENLPLGTLMQGCWNDTFDSMHKVLQELEAASLSVTRKTIPRPRGVMAAFFGILRSWRIY